MKTGERAQAILSEFSCQYFFVVMEGEELRVGMSDSRFARAILPDLEEAISKAEHHEKKAEAREKARKEAPREDPE